MASLASIDYALLAKSILDAFEGSIGSVLWVLGTILGFWLGWKALDRIVNGGSGYDSGEPW